MNKKLTNPKLLNDFVVLTFLFCSGVVEYGSMSLLSKGIVIVLSIFMAKLMFTKLKVNSVELQCFLLVNQSLFLEM